MVLDDLQRLPTLLSAPRLPADTLNSPNDLIPEEFQGIKAENEVEKVHNVALWDVATGILDESVSLSFSTNWMFLPGLLHTSIPLLSLFLNTTTLTQIDWTPQTITLTFILHLCAALIGMTVMASHFGFLVVGVSDFRRREYFQRRLSAVMSDGYVMVKGEVVKIPMDRAHNVAAWWYLRACLQDWGLSYFRRISAYTGFFLVYVGLLVAIALIQSYIIQGTVENSVYAYVILHSFSLSGLIGGMIIYGNKYNESRKRAGLFLAQRKVDIETEIAYISRHQRHIHLRYATSRLVRNMLSVECCGIGGRE
ncbi:hypothetical protein BC829DRAFT_232966 [Chytridium lagenaria]|nr:hypothetical protein BC829DRAFT_232966 [Chytridium lagenaria]